MSPRKSSNFADLFFAQTLHQQFNDLGLRASNQNSPLPKFTSIFKK